MLKIIQLIYSPIKSLWNHFWQSILPIFLSFRGYGSLILKKYDVFNTIQFILIVLFFFKPCKENPKCIRNTIRNTRNVSYFGKIRNASKMHHKYLFSPSLHPSPGLILKHFLSFTHPSPITVHYPSIPTFQHLPSTPKQSMFGNGCQQLV